MSDVSNNPPERPNKIQLEWAVATVEQDTEGDAIGQAAHWLLLELRALQSETAHITPDERLAVGLEASAAHVRESPAFRWSEYEKCIYHYLRGFLSSHFPLSAAKMDAIHEEAKRFREDRQ